LAPVAAVAAFGVRREPLWQRHDAAFRSGCYSRHKVNWLRIYRGLV
jgi:hypothetical protein